MLEQENISTSAIKILEAATDLFARENFDAVSIKQIAAASGVNSALISYYFGGKKNLYQEALTTQAKQFISLQDKIRMQDISPLAKLRSYVDSIAAIQAEHPYRMHLIFRELLMPTPTFDGFVKNYLYRVHRFMAELVEAAIAEGEIGNKMLPTHVAFTLESIMLFFFLSYNHVRLLGNFEAGQEIEYLYRDMNSFLESLKK